MAFAGPTSAAKPGEQACLGKFLSGAAQTFGVGFGPTVAFSAGPNSPR